MNIKIWYTGYNVGLRYIIICFYSMVQIEHNLVLSVAKKAWENLYTLSLISLSNICDRAFCIQWREILRNRETWKNMYVYFKKFLHFIYHYGPVVQKSDRLQIQRLLDQKCLFTPCLDSLVLFSSYGVKCKILPEHKLMGHR